MNLQGRGTLVGEDDCDACTKVCERMEGWPLIVKRKMQGYVGCTQVGMLHRSGMHGYGRGLGSGEVHLSKAVLITAAIVAPTTKQRKCAEASEDGKGWRVWMCYRESYNRRVRNKGMSARVEKIHVIQWGKRGGGGDG